MFSSEVDMLGCYLGLCAISDEPGGVVARARPEFSLRWHSDDGDGDDNRDVFITKDRCRSLIFFCGEQIIVKSKLLIWERTPGDSSTK